MENTSIDVMQDPGVKHAWDKLQSFRADFTDVERRINESTSAAGRLRHGEHIGPTEAAAEALVAGAPVKDVDKNLEELRTNLSAGWGRLRVLHRAVELQEKVLQKEESRASREICERIEPEYRAIVAGLVKSMITLGKATMADITFFEALRDGGVSHGSLTRMNVIALGDPRDRNSRLAMWFQECITFGLIDEATVPADWRERWNK